jgi:hypothetical protein
MVFARRSFARLGFYENHFFSGKQQQLLINDSTLPVALAPSGVDQGITPTVRNCPLP